MATIPLGNFGQQQARPGPMVNIPRDNPLGDATTRLDDTIGRVQTDMAAKETEREEIARRAEAANTMAVASNKLQDAHDMVARGVSDGSIDPKKASDALREASGKVMTDTLKGYTPDQQALMGAHFEQLQGGLQRNLQGVIVKRQQTETASTLDQFAEQQSRIAMREGPGKAAERYGSMVDFAGGAAGLTEAQQQKLKQSFSERVHYTFYEQAGIGALTAGNAKALQDLREQVAGPAGEPLDPMKRATLQHQLYTWQKQLEHQAKSEQDVAEKMAFDELKGLRTFADAGQAPSQAYIDRFSTVVKGTRFEQEGMQLLNLSIMGGAFGSQTLPDQRRFIEANQNKPLNFDEAERLNHMRTIFGNQETAYKEDPWDATARFQRGFPPVPVVPMKGPGDLLAVAQSRVPLMAKVEVASGRPAPLLRPEEVPQAVQVLQSLPINARTQMLGQIGSMLNTQQMTAFAEQLDKSNRPLALSLYMGNDKTVAGRNASELVQIGAQALNDKTVKKDDTALAGWRAEIASLVRGSVGDAKVEQNIIDAAYYVRAAQELEGAAATGYKLETGAANAVAMVAGMPIERGGQRTILPRGMKEDDFDTKAREQLAPLAGKTLYIRGQEISAESLANRWGSYGLRMVRPGMYVPVSNNAPVTADKEGTTPLIVKVN